jgi:hypothetical protein
MTILLAGSILQIEPQRFGAIKMIAPAHMEALRNSLACRVQSNESPRDCFFACWHCHFGFIFPLFERGIKGGFLRQANFNPFPEISPIPSRATFRWLQKRGIKGGLGS